MAGGIFEIERRLAQCLEELPGVSVATYATADEHTLADLPLWKPLRVYTFPFTGPHNFRWSRELGRAFVEVQAEVAHLHVLWMHTSLIARRWASINKRPFVTTLNGMLEPWAVGNARWKKRICTFLYEGDCLKRARCIQANSLNELRSARHFGLRNPVCVIPNGVDLPELSGDRLPTENAAPSEYKTILYLGRLHPKKGLLNLLAAWQLLSRDQIASDWRLVIAGWDQGGHEARLQEAVRNFSLSNSVSFAGPLFGDQKTAVFLNSNAFVLPSYSEGLPMAVLEAWAHAKPVLMTPQCNLPEGFQCGAAIAAEPNSQSLAEGLRQLIERSDQERSAMGGRGLELVKQRFTWPRVAAEMHSVYRWLVGGGAAPDCVIGR